MGITRDIASSIAGGYYISPPCYAIPHNCYIAGCYTAIFKAKKVMGGAIPGRKVLHLDLLGAIPL